METFKIGILEPNHFSTKALKQLERIGKVELYEEKSSIQVFLSDKNVVFVRLKYDINDNLVACAHNLRYICSPTTGLNHINLSNDNVYIISLKGEYDFLETIRATPEHVFGLSLALLRNYKCAFLDSDNNEWDRDKYRGEELFGASVGIIGMGRIGKLLGNYYSAFGSSVYYYDVDKKSFPENKWNQCKSITELISCSDLVILEANYTEDNRCMINERLLKMMKGKYFINAARGELVDEFALLECIEDDIFKGVALDVISDECKCHNNLIKLLSLVHNRNLIITPHIGGATFSSMHRTEEFIVEKLSDILKNEAAR